MQVVAVVLAADGTEPALLLRTAVGTGDRNGRCFSVHDRLFALFAES